MGYMYLKQSPNKKTGRIYLSMVHNYWDKEAGRSRTKTVESFGYVDELEKTYTDPVTHYKNVVEIRNLEAKNDDAEYTIVANKNQILEKNTLNRRNYGYIITQIPQNFFIGVSLSQ